MNLTPWHIAFHSGMSAQSAFRACINAGAPAGVVTGLLTTQQLFNAIPRFIREARKLREAMPMNPFESRRIQAVTKLLQAERYGFLAEA